MRGAIFIKFGQAPTILMSFIAFNPQLVSSHLKFKIILRSKKEAISIAYKHFYLIPNNFFNLSLLPPKTLSVRAGIQAA